jgi:hypothetical protein
VVTSDVGRELLRDIHPERKLLQRFLPPKFRKITQGDIAAAGAVSRISNAILFLALKKKDRWHPNRADGSYTTDWTIIRMRLRDRLSAREIAAQLGLDPSGSDVTRRFKAALATISEVVDPQKILIPANRGVQTSIERRNTSLVLKLPIDAGLAAWADDVLQRATAKIWPPISHHWPSAKAALWSTGWFNDGEVRNRAPRLFVLICKYQSRGWWTTEVELVNAFSSSVSLARFRAGGFLWSGACDVWQPINEDTRLLNFAPLYDSKKMRSERTHLIHLIRAPRGAFSANINSLNFAGPVIEKDGKVYPRTYGSNRIIAGGAAADDAWLNVETVTRFERAVTRADDEPLFEQFNA